MPVGVETMARSRDSLHPVLRFIRGIRFRVLLTGSIKSLEMSWLNCVVVLFLSFAGCIFGLPRRAQNDYLLLRRALLNRLPAFG